jgi:hypothetical protein
MSKKLTPRSKKEEKKLEPWEEDLLDFDKIWEEYTTNSKKQRKNWKNRPCINYTDDSQFDEIEEW